MCKCSGSTGICQCECVRKLENLCTEQEETIINLRDQVEMLQRFIAEKK